MFVTAQVDSEGLTEEELKLFKVGQKNMVVIFYVLFS
jgi:hypothetical protein